MRYKDPSGLKIDEFQEMQVHGPVALAQDVARLVVHRDSHNGDDKTLEQLRAFGKKFGVPVVWMDDGESV